MSEPRTTTAVTLAGRTFDPLAEQLQQGQDDEPIDPDRVVLWIVQFAIVLTAADVSDLRATYPLQLTEYVGAGAYIESLAGSAAEAVRADDRVRSVMSLTADLKVAPTTWVDDGDDEPSPPVTVDVVLVDSASDADVDSVRALVPADAVLAVLDDRMRGGSAVIRLVADPVAVERLAAMDSIRWIEPVPLAVDDHGTSASPVQARWDDPASATAGVDIAVSLGLSGAGQVIGMLDSGPPDVAHCFFVDPSHADPGPNHRKIVAVHNVSGTAPGGHATFTSGIAGGDDAGNPGTNPRRGLAWGARLVCGNRLDLAGSSTLAALGAAGDSGALVHSNSWHACPQGVHQPATYDQISVDVDTFAWLDENQLILGSSGNTGEEQGPPGTAKNSLCISAGTTPPPGTDTVGDGCAGPTADGRRKPDLTAVGCDVQSAIVGTPCDVGSRDTCASSYATPWAAALAALVRQQLTDGRTTPSGPSAKDGVLPSAALIRAILLNAAASTSLGTGVPSDARGWGQLDPAAALGQGAPRLLLDVRHSDGLTTGDTLAVPLTTFGVGALAVTLVWTEPPGTLGAETALVNRLALRAVDPTGQTVVATDSDPTQPVQMVLLEAAPAGAWLLVVDALEVNIGAPRQGLAVVVSAAAGLDVAGGLPAGTTALLTTPWPSTTSPEVRGRGLGR